MSKLWPMTEVSLERDRQEEKWGQQNWPSFDSPLETISDRLAAHGICFTEDEARANCETASNEGRLTYSRIFMEEVVEAMSTTNVADLRKELIQVAAVAVAWAESLDRNGR